MDWNDRRRNLDDDRSPSPGHFRNLRSRRDGYGGRSNRSILDRDKGSRYGRVSDTDDEELKGLDYEEYRRIKRQKLRTKLRNCIWNVTPSPPRLDHGDDQEIGVEIAINEKDFQSDEISRVNYGDGFSGSGRKASSYYKDQEKSSRDEEPDSDLEINRSLVMKRTERGGRRERRRSHIKSRKRNRPVSDELESESESGSDSEKRKKKKREIGGERNGSHRKGSNRKRRDLVTESEENEESESESSSGSEISSSPGTRRKKRDRRTHNRSGSHRKNRTSRDSVSGSEKSDDLSSSEYSSDKKKKPNRKHGLKKNSRKGVARRKSRRSRRDISSESESSSERESDESDVAMMALKPSSHPNKSKKKMHSDSEANNSSDNEGNEAQKEKEQAPKKSEIDNEALLFKEMIESQKKPNSGLENEPVVGPMPLPRAEGHISYGGALRPGEGDAIAQYVQQGKRIPRRGEVGLSAEEIQKFEGLGYVMSGSRHQRMNAIRIRKENQVYSAEDKRALAMFNYEEKAKREHTVMSDLQRLVQRHIGQDVGPTHDPFSQKGSEVADA
ncbi:NF-kappa-B-activating protein [Amborella trichopoda]|uniref:NF-kappa-B-activating protein C-terminal domain-containing protein n=1 Tax=Amborella trichopoda TaxID=13333 RepID=W1PZL6_AMBTC|nr:NF-kappa-B-activating protein [Amborella trichopoda]XP_020527586.1 NF-kappa-B-activating protein [Amborella trichopoda]XP_020527587.1 NF-kappa-B-activating protein [Amborella trichopoda]ERN13843.1 hypothetical protein AMTR_s00049p00226580 [Amborella trichopoda]|eukprot:XP_011626207.1 NF-kappa-B-activating protein [Amborella trichopoda]